mgnify:CR=1 FL=1
MPETMHSQPNFSHVSYASDYMEIAVQKVATHFDGDLAGKRVLDIPAGNGWVSEELSKMGAEAVSADINEEKPHFSQVDMEKPLPFADNHFDAIVCCEGIEHVFSPFNLFAEFARTLKNGGILVITTPNVQNLYSRWQYLCTGYLFQFDPFNKIPLKDDVIGDKGHILPVSYGQLRYYTEHFNMKTESPSGGRMKRTILLPLLLPFLMIGVWWNYRDWRRTSNKPERKEIIFHLFKLRVLLSRSLIFVATR